MFILGWVSFHILVGWCSHWDELFILEWAYSCLGLPLLILWGEVGHIGWWVGVHNG